MQWLYRAYNLQEEADELYAQLCRERDKLMKVTAALDSIPVTSSKDPHKYDAICDLSMHYGLMISRRVQIIAEVNAVIEQVPKKKYRDVLRYRFIDSWKFEVIAEAIDRQPRQTYNIYKEALKAVRPIVEKKIKS